MTPVLGNSPERKRRSCTAREAPSGSAGICPFKSARREALRSARSVVILGAWRGALRKSGERQRSRTAAPGKTPRLGRVGGVGGALLLGRWDPGGPLQASPVGFRRELAHRGRRPEPRWTAIGHEVDQPITQSRQGKAQEPGTLLAFESAAAPGSSQRGTLPRAAPMVDWFAVYSSLATSSTARAARPTTPCPTPGTA